MSDEAQTCPRRMSEPSYLPDYITEAHVYLNHDGNPIMMALWNNAPWLFYWRDDPPTWVSYKDMSRLSNMWDAMHSPLWQQRWLSDERANIYHKLAFPSEVAP